MFTEMMSQTLYIRRFVSMSASGTNTYSPVRGTPPATFLGRLEASRRLIAKSDGTQVISEYKIFTKDLISVGDLIILDGQEWVVLQVVESTDFFGQLDHREVRV